MASGFPRLGARRQTPDLLGPDIQMAQRPPTATSAQGAIPGNLQETAGRERKIFAIASEHAGRYPSSVRRSQAHPPWRWAYFSLFLFLAFHSCVITQQGKSEERITRELAGGVWRQLSTHSHPTTEKQAGLSQQGHSALGTFLPPAGHSLKTLAARRLVPRRLACPMFCRAGRAGDTRRIANLQWGSSILCRAGCPSSAQGQQSF